jgi:hypothetical protein
MRWRRVPGRLLLAVVLAGALLCPAAFGRADRPLVTENGDALRTVTWTFAGTDNLTLQGADISGARAVLPWELDRVAWDREDFEANGSLGDDLIVGVGGLELSADSTNPVADPDFAEGTSWVFAAGPSGQVGAAWDPVAETALLGHDSASTEVAWDNMDRVDAGNWTGEAPVGASVMIVQGAGRMEVQFSTAGTATYVVARRTSSTDWSAGDRLILWINATDVFPPVSFNITAFVSGAFRTTPALPLASGWQEVSIDLSPLGGTGDRAALTDLSFRVNAQDAPPTLIYFDDARLGVAKRFDEAALVAQSVLKANETTPAPGSTYLSFDWSVVNATGNVLAEAVVNLSGPSGSFERPFGGAAPTAWETFREDVSPTAALPGTYVVSFRFRVAADTTSASHVNLRIDNVSLLAPDRENATYFSRPVELRQASEFLSVAWSASLVDGTSARLSLRSGNSTDTSSPSWSPWASWGVPGSNVLALPGARHFQIQVQMNTTNASRSPVVESLSIETRNRVASGTIVSDAFTALSGFLRWRSFRGNWSGPSGTSIAFAIGDDTFWTPVPSSGDIGSAPGAVLRWRAILTTNDGLSTPELSRVDAVYEIHGAPILALLLPYSVGAVALAGAVWLLYGVVTRRMFSIDDVFLISKDGRLLMHNTRRMRADRDEDILSGMLSAIVSFVRDADPEENGELRRFELGGKTTLLERGKDVFVSVVYSGRVPRWAAKDLRRFVRDLETEFGSAFAQWNGAKEDLPGLKEATRRFVSRVRYRSPRADRRPSA